ncbi:hypothetical protein FB451DRAFT_1399606 [Mycena latifolia]|nr:hypothetical protein FB451DRAFT_1399606 [Mycena latifolia]
MGNMTSSYETSPWYWTGIAALVPQTYLLALSWAIFRNPYYEIFQKLHLMQAPSQSRDMEVLIGITAHPGFSMAALFIHVNFRLTSWDYFWATAAIYGLAWLSHVVRTLYMTGFGIPTTVESPGPVLIMLTIRPPAQFKWAPSQHVFVFSSAHIRAAANYATSFFSTALNAILNSRTRAFIMTKVEWL